MSALKIKTTTEKINQPKSCDFQYNEIFLDLFRFVKFQFLLSDNRFFIPHAYQRLHFDFTKVLDEEW